MEELKDVQTYSNLEYTLLTRESFDKAVADLFDEGKLKKRQREESRRSRDAAKAICRCHELIHDEKVPDEIKGYAWGLIMSVGINGFAVCSKEIRDKLMEWW